MSNPEEERFEQQFKDLCLEHRMPRAALERRKKKVVDWAFRNWEKLEEEALKAEEAEREANAAMQTAGLQQYMRMQQQMTQSSLNSLSGLGGFNQR
jgi:hypothetical protein